MRMQGNPVSSPHDGALSDSGIDSWLEQTAGISRQQLAASQQLSNRRATASTPAAAPADAPAPAVASQSAPATLSKTERHDAVLGSVSDSQRWFDEFDLRAGWHELCRGNWQRPGGQGSCWVPKCWGPPPTSQYPAMLKGELALAVTTGVAGKSLIKEVIYLPYSNLTSCRPHFCFVSEGCCHKQHKPSCPCLMHSHAKCSERASHTITVPKLVSSDHCELCTQPDHS